jgi:mono/diheme cytochrome c family protein
MRRRLLPGCLLLLLASTAQAAESAVEVTAGAETRSFTRDVLLARPEATDITVPRDISYGVEMSYRAVPVASLFAGLTIPPDNVVEAVAADGFVAQLPLDLILNTDPVKPVAWLAIEPADKPWPNLPGKSVSAGPFYVVWTGPLEGNVRSEQWPFQLAKLVTQPSPASRWPELAVDPSLPATDPIRAGQALYAVQCLTCHRLNGAGASDVGPDLNLPMNPTEYLTPAGLHALIRDPKSVRTWPAQAMPPFPPDYLSDREIDLIVAYLQHMAGRKHAR